MKVSRKFVIVLGCMSTMWLAAGLVACSAKQAAKDAQTAQTQQHAAEVNAQAANTALIANPTDPTLIAAANAAQAKLTSAITASVLATDNYNKAVASDNSTWTAVASIVGPVGLIFGIPLGGLIDPFRKLVTGQVQGAAAATTAITNADTSNTLQTTTARDAVMSGLAGSHPAVVSAVSNAL